MCLFLFKKKKSKYLVTERSFDQSPYQIPHLSSKGSFNENPYSEFVSSINGVENSKDLLKGVKISTTPLEQYTPFQNNPEYKDNEPYYEFPKVGKRIKNETIKEVVDEDVKEIIEETKVENKFEKELYNEPQEQSSTSFESFDDSSSFNYDPNETINNNDLTLEKDLFDQEIIEETRKREERITKPRNNTNYFNNIKEENTVEIDDMYKNHYDGYTLEEISIIRSIHKSKVDYKNYRLPSMSILKSPKIESNDNHEWAESNIERINTNLSAFKIDGKVVEYTIGPTFTRYAISLAPGVSGSKIETLSLDLQRSLEAMSIRIENPIPGKPYVGIEVPNKTRKSVTLRELIDTEEFLGSNKPLLFPVGLDVEGKAKYISVCDLPHAIVAGQTGSGKSVFLNCMITSLLYKYTPEELRFYIHDPKQVDLSVYKNIPHLLAPVTTSVSAGIEGLKWLVEEMERRFSIFRLIGGAFNLQEYKEKIKTNPKFPNMPYIVIIVDEVADFLMNGGNEAMNLMIRLTQKSRAAGMYMFLALQKPNAKALSTTIKSNAPARFGLSVKSTMDSMIILDQTGEEKLLGRGDMIFSHVDIFERFQSGYVSNDEVDAICKHIENEAEQDFYFNPLVIEKKRNDRPQAVEDDLFKEVARYVVSEGKCSVNAIIRFFNMGHNRGLDIVDALEKIGVVGENSGPKPREVLVDSEELEDILSSI